MRPPGQGSGGREWPRSDGSTWRAVRRSDMWPKAAGRLARRDGLAGRLFGAGGELRLPEAELDA